jgi:hypothetical protein
MLFKFSMGARNNFFSKLIDDFGMRTSNDSPVLAWTLTVVILFNHAETLLAACSAVRGASITATAFQLELPLPPMGPSYRYSYITLMYGLRFQHLHLPDITG